MRLAIQNAEHSSWQAHAADAAPRFGFCGSASSLLLADALTGWLSRK